jgi:hypothetical protein
VTQRIVVTISADTPIYVVFGADTQVERRLDGHVRTWGELEQEQQNALIKAALADRRGNITATVTTEQSVTLNGQEIQ